MLIIRPGQMEEFSGDARARFVHKMQLHLRENFPEATASLDDEPLRRLIEGALTEAARYGLLSQRQACQFLNLCALHGWHFLKERKHQWMITGYLENSELSDPDDRIGLLVDQCVVRLRTEENNQETDESLFPKLDDDNEADGLDEDEAHVPLMEKR